MGLLSWFTGNPTPSPPKPTTTTTTTTTTDPSPQKPLEGEEGVPGMHGAVEVQRRRRPEEVAVFEFGSAGGGVTLAGYCPVSEDLEPCLWEIIPAAPGSDAPQFRIVF